MIIDPLKPIVVMYHGGGCRDGFCSAWLISRAYPSAEFVSVLYHEACPNIAGKQVIIADFSYSTETLININRQAESMVLLDHHKSAKKNILEFIKHVDPTITETDRLSYTSEDETIHIVFDETKSGAKLTHDFLVREIPNKNFDSWITEYVEDRDLWLHKLPNSRAVNAAIRMAPLEFDAWDALDMSNSSAQSIIGEVRLRIDAEYIQQHIRHAVEINFDGYDVLCVNCTTGDLISEVTGQLANGRPFGMTYFDDGKGNRIFSLRSDKNGIDVSQLAVKFGGGGHKHSAGFTLKARKLADCGQYNQDLYFTN